MLLRLLYIREISLLGNIVIKIVVCPFVVFVLTIVLSVLLRYTDYDYPFGIFKLFLLRTYPSFVPYDQCRNILVSMDVNKHESLLKLLLEKN